MIKATGNVKVLINGKKVQEFENTINPNFLTRLAAHLNDETGAQIELSNLFTVGKVLPPGSEDGIVLYQPSILLKVCLATTAAAVANVVTFTGTYTNTSGIPWIFNGIPDLGRDWNSFLLKFNYVIATGSGWISTALPATDTITVIWAITFTII